MGIRIYTYVCIYAHYHNSTYGTALVQYSQGLVNVHTGAIITILIYTDYTLCGSIIT